MSKAQGQFTIIDYNDALTLTGYIGSNLAKTQMYNPDNGSYTPDWKTKNLVLTPSLYVIGTTADQIATANVTSVKWYVGDSNTAITAGTNYGLSGAKSHILTVKANVMAELPGIDYRCVITYKDESTGLSLTHPLTISFSRVVNGSGIVDLLVTTPNGNVFKNEEVASLTAKAELWRGSTVDTTKVSYKWAVMDASVTATSSTGYDADFGIGWRKLSDTADKYTGTATNTLTVYAAAVDSYAVFKCCAQDTDSESASYNTKFFDSVTLTDVTDPTLRVYCYCRDASIYLADIMITEGAIPRKWTPAPNEIYTQEVKIDKRGIEVSNSASSQRTVITNTEFAGYYNDEVIFTLNKDETQTKKTTVDGDLTVGKTKFVPMPTASDGLNIVILD